MRTVEELADEALQHANYISDVDTRYKTLAYLKAFFVLVETVREIANQFLHEAKLRRGWK